MKVRDNQNMSTRTSTSTTVGTFKEPSTTVGTFKEPLHAAYLEAQEAIHEYYSTLSYCHTIN